MVNETEPVVWMYQNDEGRTVFRMERAAHGEFEGWEEVPLYAGCTTNGQINEAERELKAIGLGDLRATLDSIERTGG